ncbi:MAG: sigma 54-interacting transcriptional regulator [Nitrospinae bacterium]|nr:sigma 54-interacting transcriptional regulator [Nitrospinota bacterium]
MENEKIKTALPALEEKILQYGKENLYDILHFTSTGLLEIFACHGIRIFLEDLAEGLLICRYALSEKYEKARGTSCFISNEESIVSKAFVTREIIMSWEKKEGKPFVIGEFEKKLGIQNSAAVPIVDGQKSIGVVCLDYSRKPELCTAANMASLEKFFGAISSLIQQASRYYQEINFSRQVDAIRKKNAATIMLSSSVKLMEKLALASVIIPQSGPEGTAKRASPSSGPARVSDCADILAVYAVDILEREIHDNPNYSAIIKMGPILDRLAYIHPHKGLVGKDKKVLPLFFMDLLEEDFSPKAAVKKLGLRTLYMVPRFGPETGQLVCIVNYFTKEPYSFSDFERELLNDHAKMLERMIQDVGREHIEIKILSEIEALRQEKDADLAHFLKRVLSMASELIGADTGTISLLKNINGTPWLVVEDADGKTIGAKAREWQKRLIPPLRVGGHEIPKGQRSLTGLAAHTKRPIMCNDVGAEAREDGFYLEVSTLVKSELAIPILSGEEVIGVISLDSFIGEYFTIEHQRILSIISRLIAERVRMWVKIETLQEEIRFLQKELHYRDPKVSSYSFGNIIGKSPKVREIVENIRVVSEYLAGLLLQWQKGPPGEMATGVPSILIMGNTGSGKEFFFNNIYSMLQEIIKRESGREVELPLRKTNIAAYSGELTYSELFGHKKGAYTGADSDRKGILEEADGGIVFLDEIGDADHKTQVQLLRFLDNGVSMRLGESKSRHSRVVLVAATNKDLKEEIRKGKFREDLYHRLSELTLRIPSLTERREDVPDLATHFLGKLYLTCKKKDEPSSPPQLDEGAKKFLAQYPFKGNVRELRSMLLRALLFRKGNRITARDVKMAISEGEIKNNDGFSSAAQARDIIDAIKNGESDFWEAVYRPYSKKAMTRQTVKEVIEMGKEEFGNGIPNLALKLKVCSSIKGNNREETLKFQKFKNFIYKTIKITFD